MQISVLAGPSIFAPFPAVLATFPDPGGPARPADAMAGHLRDFLAPELYARLALPLADGGFATVTAAIAGALQDCHGPNGLPVRTGPGPAGACRVALGYRDPAAAVVALETGRAVALALFEHLAGRPFDARGLAARLQQAAAFMLARQPDQLARALMRVADRRRIPVYPVAPGSRVWQYGQGRAALHGFEVASNRDGMTGSRIARDKYLSNNLVNRLGLPGVRHLVVDSLDRARRAAAEIGYPVVVKPVDGSKGRGVTVGISDDAGLATAFAAASVESPGKVLVEEQVAGEDHRLVVLGGRFAWAVRRSPPQVTGDGAHTVARLVELENARRLASPNPDIAGKPISLDAEAGAWLRGQGLQPGDVPSAGAPVRLGGVANISRGGTLADCSATVHPDNIAMAEAIARACHLDAVGIDFMTPDVSRSWREVPCAVLEFNGTPGFSSDARAELILAQRFPGSADGRLPGVLVVGTGRAVLDGIAGAIAATGRVVGSTDAGETRLGRELRCRPQATLGERVHALLLDPACEALVVGATAGHLEQWGLPLDHFDVVLIIDRDALSAPVAGLLRDHATAVVDAPGEAGLIPAALGALAPRLRDGRGG